MDNNVGMCESRRRAGKFIGKAKENKRFAAGFDMTDRGHASLWRFVGMVEVWNLMSTGPSIADNLTKFDLNHIGGRFRLTIRTFDEAFTQ